METKDAVSKIKSLIAQANIHPIGNTLISLGSLSYWVRRLAMNDPSYQQRQIPLHSRSNQVPKKEQKRLIPAYF